jgi:hypothetical protein
MKKPQLSLFRAHPVIWAASICFAGHANADLVAKWQAADFNLTTEEWPSSVGSITARVMGTDFIYSVANAFNDKPGLDFPGGTYFNITEAENPLSGASAMTLVAVFEPQVTGTIGTSWYQGTGIIGMEQANSVPDWGLGLSGDRIVAGSGGPDVTLFSNPVSFYQTYVVIYTWNSSGQQRLFVNGVEQDVDLGVSTSPRNGGAFAIGAMTSDGINPLVGYLAEVQLHNSDESANAATLSETLLEEYASVGVRSLDIRPDGATMVLVDGAKQVDISGTATLELDGVPLPSELISLSKTGKVTTVTVTGELDPGQTYSYYLQVPLVGNSFHDITGTFQTQRLAETLPGPEGTVGSWGIREFKVTTATDINSAMAAAISTTDASMYVDGVAPVLNHSDPDTNGPRSSGNFNNDFPILSDEPGDQYWVVVGKTKVSIPAPGVYTFSIQSDDGFAMRISGAGGGRFISTYGPGTIDPGDNRTLMLDGGTANSDTRGVYEFDAAGEYDLMYLGWDGGGGGYHEVSWAPGQFAALRDTNTWTLVGTPSDPSLPPFRPRYVAAPAGPIGTASGFGVRTYLEVRTPDGGTYGDLLGISDFLANTTRIPSTDPLTFDGTIPYLSASDPQATGGRGEFPVPGNSPADDDHVASVVKGTIAIQTAGYYTFWCESDDGFLLRIKGTNGNPNPSFKRVTQGAGDGNGRFEMSNPNEMFFDAPTGNADTRGIIYLAAGHYDIEFIHHEIGSGFNYVLRSAAGEWPHGTDPANGFQPVGFTPLTENVLVPYMKDDWKVESSTPNRPEHTSSIGGSRAAINATLADPSAPEAKTSFWPSINFVDPETNATAGHHEPSNPWPLNTPADDDNYAMRADGVLVITTPGEYHLGFQGDDGGYMYIDGLNGLATPSWLGVAFSNHAAQVRIEELVPDSGINNAMVLEIGTGNSRTLGRVNLEVGEYRIRTLMFEGGGGSWWEVIGAKGDVNSPSTFVYPLLAKGTANSSVAVRAGLPLVEPGSVVTPPGDPLNLSGFTVTGSPVTGASFSISSTEGKTYRVEATTDFITWITLIASVPATGTTTPVTINLAAIPQLNNQPKVFFRVREN